MEELETLEGTECPECPGPPPEFRLPPPPRPPFLTEGTFCSEAPLAELEDCVAIPMIDASYHTNPSLQSTALIITSAVILLLMAAIISVVFWKHKRKVQNLLPCKSAAGAAAAAAAASSRGRGGGGGGVLPEGQGGSVLYEDLPDAVSHSQQRSGVQNHFANHLLQNSLNHVQHQYPGLPGHPLHQRPVQPTIEVREFPEAVVQKRSKAPAPAPHHLDYLDYRDPRAILRVADKPSRAVLGGYRTPRALLAKSQGVPFAMAASHTNGPQNSILQGPQDPEINRYHIRSNYGPITPTHRPRLGTPTRQKSSPQLETRRDNRRPSVDSEGYSFVDFRRDNTEGVSQSPTEQRLLGPETRRSNSVDSEGYSYILETNNRVRTPGVARRVVVSNEATEEEVCPLCTVQRIHGLLSRPEDAYRTGVTESS